MPAKVNTAPVHRAEAVAADLDAVAVDIAAVAVDIAAVALDTSAAVDLAAVARDTAAPVGTSAAVDVVAAAVAAVGAPADDEKYNQQSMASPLHRMMCRNSSCNSHCPWPTLCV